MRRSALQRPRALPFPLSLAAASSCGFGLRLPCHRLLFEIGAGYQFAVAPSWKVTNLDIGHFGWGIGSDNPPNPVMVDALADSTVRQREFRAASSQRGHFPRYWTLRAKHQIFVTNCHTRSIVYNARTVALNLATGHRRDTHWDAPYPPPVADPAVPLAPPKWWGFFCLSSYAFLRRRRESNFLEAPTPR